MGGEPIRGRKHAFGPSMVGLGGVASVPVKIISDKINS
jgi:hypothetical protein